MKITKIALVLTFSLFVVCSASAQLGIYGTVTVRRMTGVDYTEGNQSFTNGNFIPVGGTGGIYYDFFKLGPVKLGVDARGTITSSAQGVYKGFDGAGGHISSGLGGVRATFHTPFLSLKPYVEGMVGVARTNYGKLYNNTLIPSGGFVQGGYYPKTALEYDGLAGVDLRLLPVLDFRIVELGYGAIHGNSQFPVGVNGNTVEGTAHTYPVGTISTGFVFHFPLGLGK